MHINRLIDLSETKKRKTAFVLYLVNILIEIGHTEIAGFFVMK